MNENGYTNGYIERRQGGRYDGRLTIEGVDISPIDAMFFRDKEKQSDYLWLKRKPMLDYDDQQHKYVQRQRKPIWEAYLKKSKDGSIAYRGTFAFLRFRYEIYAQWDRDITQDDKFKRLNLYVERLPMNEQTIINQIKDNNNDK